MQKLPVAVILLGASVAGAAPASKAKLSIGAPTVSGALDAKALDKVIKRSSTKLLLCYKRALVKAPDLQGTATATFTIGADGKVTAAAATGLTATVEACIAATISKLRFAKPKDGQPVDVTYPLTYDPESQLGAFASLTGTGDISSGFDDANIYGGLLGNEAGEMQGGWGLGTRGDGAGGGGTGWGTIGTGRYGTLGTGSGSGYGVGGGRGGMRGRSGDLPTTKIGQPGVTGDLDKAIIRRYVRRQLQKVQYCYEKELLAKPKLQGTLTAAFTIGVDGLVVSSTASGLKDKAVEDCVARVFRGIQFPKPKSGAVTVSYPFTFLPASGAPAPKP